MVKKDIELPKKNCKYGMMQALMNVRPRKNRENLYN